MSNIAAESNATVTWSTWEELLLAFAVKRYGLKDWDTVAKELQSRHRSSALITAEICKGKYQNLRKRFVNRQNNNNRSAATGGGERKDVTCSGESDGDDNNDVLDNDGGIDGGEGGESFAWLEELRKLRVAELKMEVQRHDISIKSLEMKVKTMEEEKEKSLDLDGGMERSESDKNNGEKTTSGTVAGNSVSGDENRSFNESNSTENTRTGLTIKPEPVEVEPNHKILKPVGEEDSCNDSSDRKARHEREKDGVDPAELLNLSSELREESQGTKGSSDVQSSASLMTTRRNKRINKMEIVGSGGGGGKKDVGASTSTVRLKSGPGVAVKAEALFGVLDIIRLHKHGSVFQRRLQSQKSSRYKNMIRQHVDLETVQSRLESGSYSSCPTKIYVDLLLLFNNAIVFFPKSSSESRAAHELRQLVMKNLKQYSASSHPPQDPLPRPESQRKRSDPLLVNQKSTAPIVVCKKRSSILPKASPTVNKVEKHGQDKFHSLSTSNEEGGATKSKAVTGVRSARKSINGRANVNNSSSGQSANPKPGSSFQQRENSKAGKEKKAEVTTVDKKKGAADFLKRIKKNDPPKGTLAEALKTSGESIKSSSSSKKVHLIKKTDDKKDVGRSGSRSGGRGGGGTNEKKMDDKKDVGRSGSRSGGRGGGTKRSKEESSPLRKNIGRPLKKGKEVLKGKRGRDDSEEEGSSKRVVKRSRR